MGDYTPSVHLIWSASWRASNPSDRNLKGHGPQNQDDSRRRKSFVDSRAKFLMENI